MKLRQKLAAVLAATMIVSAVPVVTMAASDAKITNGVVVGTKNSDAGMGATQNLVITLKDTVATDSMIFLNLTNGEWKTTTGSDVKFSKTTQGTITVNGKELSVIVPAGYGKDDTITVDLSKVKLTGGDATVAVDGNASVISNVAPIVFATTSDAKANVTVGSAATLYTDETGVADISIEESYKAQFTSDKTIKVYLQTDDYKFTATKDNLAQYVKFEKGFGSSNPAIKDIIVQDQYIEFKVAPQPNALAPGRIVLKGLPVKATTKTPAVGELKFKVTGDQINEAVVKVADVKAYSMALTMADSKTVDMTAGTMKKVTFTLAEGVKDSLIAGRDVEVKISNGFFTCDPNTTGAGVTTKGNFAITTNTTKCTMGNISVLSDKDGWVTGFTFNLKDVDRTDISKIEFKDIPVYMPLGVTGDVKVTMTGRALTNDVEVVAANVKAPVTVTSEPVTLKVGLKDQVGGKITITETDKGMLQQGKDVVIKLDRTSAIQIADKGTLTVTGDLKTDGFDVVKDTNGNVTAIKFTVKRASTVASTIEIKDMKFTPDRTVPQGSYDATINGLAVAPDCGKDSITVSKFINIGTANTEDLATNGLKKAVAQFVIDSNKYVVNGVTKTMDAAAFLDPAGRTMVPLRFAANALGVADTDIYYADNTASIVAGGKTYSVKLGSKTAYVNGVPAQTMLVAPVMKNDRIYVPISEFAKLLGVEAAWDAATQTATFTNK